jgi:hypothetical protein
MKDPLVRYYLQQAGRGGLQNGIEHMYTVSPFLQRGSGIGSFLSGLFRMVRPVLWSDAKAVEREALRTSGNILTDIAANTSPDIRPGGIVHKRLGETAQTLIQKLRGNGRRKRARSPKNKKKLPPRKKTKKARPTKRDIFA